MTQVGNDILAFYRELPFNYWPSRRDEIAAARRLQIADICPTLAPLLRAGARVLEVGCGVGWLSCYLAESYGCEVTAIDFNPVAIDRAQTLAAEMQVHVDFRVADLFSYEPQTRFEIVVSNGVLMCTGDCIGAMRRCMDRFAAPASDFVVGLYHRFGRKPFLDHFAALIDRQVPEDALVAEYRRLHWWLDDPTHAYSWFRDQVHHPHETQHVLRDVVDTARASGFELVATSINHFASIAGVEDLYALEPLQEGRAIGRLQEGQFFPGFFTTHVRRRPRADRQAPSRF